MNTIKKYAFLAGLANLLLHPVHGQVTDESIRTWVHPITNWNMEDNQGWISSVTVPPGMSNDKIVGIKVLIYSDAGDPEVFNLTRKGNKRAQATGGELSHRGGGWAEISLTSTGMMDISLNRGECVKDGAGSCSGVYVQSFFAARSDQIGSKTFPFAQSRVFKSTTKLRGVIKIDYICPTCAPSTPNVFWKKIGPWDMAGRNSPHVPQASVGVSPTAIIDLSATIHSDPGSITDFRGDHVGSNAIVVDDLEHQGNRSAIPNPVISQRARGGFLWLGYGCRIPGATGSPARVGCGSDGIGYDSKKYNLFSGPVNGTGAGSASYRTGEISFSDLGSASVPYRSTAINRGWLRVEYTGAKSAIPVPYAFKSMAIPLGPWDMESASGLSIDFLQYGIAANRVSRITTTIHSNPLPYAGGTYRIISNFNRQRYFTGTGHHPDPYQRGGGGELILEHFNTSENRRKSNILFQRGVYNLDYTDPDYYSQVGTSPTYTGTTHNRGYALVDYQAGSCEQGPAGFKIQAIPGTQVGDCAGSASTFTLEGAGADIWGQADDFAFVHNAGSGDVDIQVRIESQAAAHEWAKSGLMIRDGLGKNARHASILATPNVGANRKGLHFAWRETQGGSSGQSGLQGYFAPYYLRLVKQGTTFTAYARASTSSSWQTIGTRTINGFPSTYYYGLAQASHDHTLARSVFSGFAAGPVNGAIYRVINVNSGKALEVAGNSTANGGNVQQWTYANTNTQKWRVVDNGQGYWKLVNVNSGKVLDVSGGTGATHDGANVHQWTDFGATNQQWYFADLGAGIYRVTARHSGKALDVSGASLDNGANVHQWTSGNGNNQKWRFMAP